MKNQKTQKEEVYYEWLSCWNCGEKENVKIPKGMTIEEYNEKTICSNCGCNRRLK